jgi:DNA-binding NarL/FixJ family response regulator
MDRFGEAPPCTSHQLLVIPPSDRRRQNAGTHLVLMDISMPGLNGIDATRRLVTELHAKVVAVSMNADRRYVVAMSKQVRSAMC